MKKFLRTFLSLNPTSITMVLTILVIFLFLVGISFLDLVELKTFDLRFISRGTLKPSPTVVMAAIDEKSLDGEGRWPWPRSKFARLVDILSEDGAKVIGFDVGFLEPDENSSLKIINELDRRIEDLQITNPALNAFLQESKQDADNDLALAKAIERSKAAVILGYFFHMTQKGLEYKIQEKEIQKTLAQIADSRYPVIKYETQEMLSDPFINAYAPEVAIEMLTRAAPASGSFNMLPDVDGVVRWLPLAIKCEDDIFPPLAIQTVWHYLDKPPLMVKVASYGIEGIQMGDHFIPTDETGQMLINFLGPEKTFPYYSITDILHGKHPKGTFKDKIVLVGATAIGIYDVRNTPFSPVYPGPEVHATVMDNILTNNLLNKPEWARIYDVLAILIFGLLCGLVIPRVAAIYGTLFAALLFIVHIMATYSFFSVYGLWINMVYPLLAIVLIYTSLTLYHYITEERERKKIRGAFSYYVSSSVVNEMLKNPDKLKLGGDKKDLSVLFSDIRGFTTISEGLTPEELVHLLNEYLTVMTDIVFKYDGTLDKYMGDAIMAIYGAPLEQPDHPARACRSALEMMAGLKQLNDKWIAEGKAPLDIGIGINTGMMMVGNMGSDQRFDYTVMGDSVNLGSRLEGANKSYKTNILISEYTHAKVKDEFACMEVDSVRVKGKSLPVKIFQLIGEKGIPEDHMEAVRLFESGLVLYKQQKWDDAIEVFDKVMKMQKGVNAAEIYIQRTLDLKSDPPPPEWNGVFIMKTK